MSALNPLHAAIHRLIVQHIMALDPMVDVNGINSTGLPSATASIVSLLATVGAL